MSNGVKYEPGAAPIDYCRLVSRENALCAFAGKNQGTVKSVAWHVTKRAAAMAPGIWFFGGVKGWQLVRASVAGAAFVTIFHGWWMKRNAVLIPPEQRETPQQIVKR